MIYKQHYESGADDLIKKMNNATGRISQQSVSHCVIKLNCKVFRKISCHRF